MKPKGTLRRDIIRMRSGSVHVAVPVEEMDADTMDFEDRRFVTRISRIAKAMERKVIFAYVFMSAGKDDELPIIHAFFTDEIESIRPAFVTIENGTEMEVQP